MGKLLTIALIVIFLVCPIFEIKLLIINFIIWRIFRGQTYTKEYVFLLLSLVGIVSFIISPYWQVFFSLPILKYAMLLFLFLGIISWAYIAKGQFNIPKLQNVPLLLIGEAILYVLTYSILGSDIAWRGDEDSHLSMIWHFVSYLNFWWQRKEVYLFRNPLFFGIILGLILRWFGYPKIKSANHRLKTIFLIGLLLIIAVTAALIYPTHIFKDPQNPLLLSEVLRYPFLEKWINFLFIPPQIYADIRVYRMVPFLSLVGILWVLYQAIHKKVENKIIALFISLGLTTIPLSLYYGTILYLEMPVILLMLIASLNLKSLITKTFSDVKKLPAWYALLLVGFMKESALIFPALVCALRLGYIIRSSRKEIRCRRLFIEMGISGLLLGPGVAFLLIRDIFLHYHSYIFRFENAFVPRYYTLEISNLVQQLGLLCVMGFLGLGLALLKKRNYALIHAVVLFGIMIFFICYVYLDTSYSAAGIIYAGYSRWNLYLLPTFYTLTVYFFSLCSKSQLILITICLLVSNILLSPFKNGVRFPNWGSPINDAGEYTYPYEKSIHFINDLKNIHTVLLVGQYTSYYGIPFYLNKYKLEVEIGEYAFGDRRFDKKKESEKFYQFEQLLKDGKIVVRGKIPDVILYTSINGIDLDANKLYAAKYKIYKIVKNSFHKIYLFTKITEMSYSYIENKFVSPVFL